MTINENGQRGVSLIELLMALAFVSLAMAGVIGLIAITRENRQAADLVQMMEAARSALVLSTQRMRGTAVDMAAGGTYAHVTNAWLVRQIDQRFTQGGGFRLPVAGATLTVAGVAPPWPTGVPAETARNVALLTVDGVPRAVCAEVVVGMARTFERVEISTNVARDRSMGVQQPLSQIGTWCDASPTSTLRAYLI